MKDPFTQTYEGLWTLVERNLTLKRYIALGNRVKFDEKNAIKEEISDADVPELSLMLAGASPGTANSSTSRSIIKQYIWGVASGSFTLNPGYNIVAFELWRSLIDYESTLCRLEWGTNDDRCTFIQKMNLTSVDETLTNQELNRLIEGWSGLWLCEVEMVFPLRLLRLEPIGEN